jgi:glycosyltransferase involved in cell wall biosynthesis
MNPPTVSIIVATFNAQATLDRCLQSIFAQTSTQWKLLVVDGGSSDRTVGIIRANAGRIAYWHSRSDAGIYDAWNQALERARGDYVCFLGADDAWKDEGSLQALLDATKGAQPDLVSAKGQLVDEGLKPCGVIGAPWNYRALRRRMRICHPGALFRRELFHQFGKFDTRYRIVADYDWLLRLPESTTSRFVDRVVTTVGHAGVSRKQVWRRLRERRQAHMRCHRIGPALAYVYWLDKLWRMPIARLFGLQY